MSKIIDFNSLWEIAFATNAIFVYFELVPALERKFNGVNAIGANVINELIEEQDRKYINTYGWRSVLFGYVTWIGRLKAMSAFNSFIAILLLIVAGFSPESALGGFYLVIIILILLVPIIIVPTIIICAFPLYKLKCIEEAVQKILSRDEGEPILLNKKKRRYKIAVEYIKLTEFGSSFFVKRSKEFSDDEIFQEFRV